MAKPGSLIALGNLRRKTEMKGMRSEWSAQHARRVSMCAVLAMHVPNSGIHTLCCFPCASAHPYPLFTGKKSVRVAVALK